MLRIQRASEEGLECEAPSELAEEQRVVTYRLWHPATPEVDSLRPREKLSDVSSVDEVPACVQPDGPVVDLMKVKSRCDRVTAKCPILAA